MPVVQHAEARRASRSALSGVPRSGVPIPVPSRAWSFRIRAMTPPQLLDDVATGDTTPIAILGRHVSAETSGLSIRSFVDGRFPRHRAADIDREFSEFPELAS